MLDLPAYYARRNKLACELQPPITMEQLKADRQEYDVISLDVPEKHVKGGHVSRVVRITAATLIANRTHRLATEPEVTGEASRSEAVVADEQQREERRAPITRLVNPQTTAIRPLGPKAAAPSTGTTLAERNR